MDNSPQTIKVISVDKGNTFFVMFLTMLISGIAAFVIFSIILIKWPIFFNLLSGIYSPFASISPLDINNPNIIETGYYYDFKANVTNINIAKEGIALSTDFPPFEAKMLNLRPTTKVGKDEEGIIVPSSLSAVKQLKEGDVVGIRLVYNPRNGQWFVTQLVLF